MATRILQRRPADIRELGLARAVALKQFQPKLRFEIGDGIADDGLRAVELAAGGRETAGLCDRHQNLKLIERRVGLHVGIHLMLGWIV